jgi:hypothetical protein
LGVTNNLREEVLYPCWQLRRKVLSCKDLTLMAYADPQSVTINSVAVSLPRTGSAINAGAFTSNDQLVKLNVSHSYGKKTRRVIRLDHSKISADPLNTAQNVKYQMSTYLVTETPVSGYTVAEAKQVVDALVAYLTASTGAKVTQLLGGEN